MIDYTQVITTITISVGDVLAGGVILLGGYAGFWGIRKVLDMFEQSKKDNRPPAERYGGIFD